MIRCTELGSLIRIFFLHCRKSSKCYHHMSYICFLIKIVLIVWHRHQHKIWNKSFQHLLVGKQKRNWRENAGGSNVWGGRLRCLCSCFMHISEHWALLRMLWRTSSYYSRISPWKPKFKFFTSYVFLDGDVPVVYFDPGGTGWNLSLWFSGNYIWFWILVCILVMC